MLAALAIAGVGLPAGPAGSEDAPPDGEEPVYDCTNPQTGVDDVTTGTVIVASPGQPSPLGVSGMYLCINGDWIYLSPIVFPGGMLMPGAPDLSVDAEGIVVDEGSTATNTGTVGEAGDEPVVLSASVGNIADDGFGTWTWTYDTDDGPVENQVVSVFAVAGGLVHEVQFDLTVDNVAPTVTTVTASATSTLVGHQVEFTGAASDPSSADTAAGFAWTFDGLAAAGTSSWQSFDSCGAHTVSVGAEDDDGGKSATLLSPTVDVLDAEVLAPLEAGSYNAVKAGQVVPVRLHLGCSGTAAMGLAPTLTVISGDADPSTSTGDQTLVVTATMGSGGDSSGVMRAVGSSYSYNLPVPDAPPDSLFTIRIRPFPASTAEVAVVLRVRR